MKSAFIVILAILLLPVNVFAKNLDLNGYQTPDGAITTGFGGDHVDPYFATKALLTAMDEKLNVALESRAWIAWALQMQQPDGLFQRYRQDNGQFEAYDDTDADDAMLAMWIELLYRTAPKYVPVAWQSSIKKSEKQLAQLYNPSTGIYFISLAKPVGLLMDNIEIYAAFKRIAAEQKRLGLKTEARDYETKADLLADNILKVFRPNPDSEFLISTQARNNADFYPDKVAQLYPLYYYLPVKSTISYADWMRNYEQDWFNQRTDDFPWGLVALLSLKMGDDASAACWQNRAAPLRYGGHWNVLEEVAFQTIDWQLQARHFNDVACIGKPL